MKNTAFNYMYRDGSNFKKRGVAIFANLPTEELERRLIAALSEGLYFIAHQVRVPEVFLWDPELDYGEEYPEELIETGRYKINDMDHCAPTTSMVRYSIIMPWNTPTPMAANFTASAVINPAPGLSLAKKSME